MSGISQPFGPLCEGFDPDLRVEVGWVQQADKVCFLLGERALCESAAVPEGTTVVESIDELDLVETLDERTGATTKHVKDGRWFIEGPFQRSDVRNANKRYYPRAIWDRLIADAQSSTQKDVRAGGMLGHLEHPSDGRTDGNQGALVTRSLNLRKDGVVWGMAELLDTPKGFILQEYTRKRVRWGISSRGNGSVDDTGKVSESDYSLAAFDGVMKPSTDGAYAKTVEGSKAESTESSSEPTEVVVEARPEPTPCVTEDVQAFCREIEALCETDLMGLAPESRLAFTRELVNGLSRVNSLAGSQALSAETAADLQDWLTTKLKTVCESEEVEQVIEATVGEDSTSTDEAAEAFKRVVSSLQARNEDLARECAQVRAELQRTQRAKAAVQREATAQITTLRQERNNALAGAFGGADESAAAELQQELEATRDLLSQREAELRIATSLVSDTSEVEVRDPVAEAVMEALDAHPSLQSFQAALRGSESPEQVKELVERLAPSRTASVPLVRRALPAGLLVESEADAGKRTASTNPSRGARMAGAVVKKLGNSAS